MSGATFPLPLDAFMGRLRLEALTIDLPDRLRHSQTQGGEVLVADLGARLWTGEVRLARLRAVDHSAVAARLNLLRGAGRSFLASDILHPGPAQDRTGAGLGASQPKLASVSVDGRTISLSGLPAGYALSAGDRLSFVYGSPVRYAYHQVVADTAVAATDGTTPAFEVMPPVRPGAAVNAAVTLVAPVFKAVLVPNSVRLGASDGWHVDGTSFSLTQTLR